MSTLDSPKTLDIAEEISEDTRSRVITVLSSGDGDLQSVPDAEVLAVLQEIAGAKGLQLDFIRKTKDQAVETDVEKLEVTVEAPEFPEGGNPQEADDTDVSKGHQVLLSPGASRRLLEGLERADDSAILEFRDRANDGPSWLELGKLAIVETCQFGPHEASLREHVDLEHYCGGHLALPHEVHAARHIAACGECLDGFRLIAADAGAKRSLGLSITAALLFRTRALMAAGPYSADSIWESVPKA